MMPGAAFRDEAPHRLGRRGGGSGFGSGSGAVVTGAKLVVHGGARVVVHLGDVACRLLGGNFGPVEVWDVPLEGWTVDNVANLRTFDGAVFSFLSDEVFRDAIRMLLAENPGDDAVEGKLSLVKYDLRQVTFKLDLMSYYMDDCM
mmetsp:Transcript_116727/g.371407  ORF Transcript_116727/g.371407 Transcript_116727/m.371407 type:complete len:145 (+) Transcript_116727:468-902(+)